MGKLLRRQGRYSFRRRVPKDLRTAYGGQEVLVIALGTADPTEAAILNRKMWVQYDEEFAAKRKEQTAGRAIDGNNPRIPKAPKLSVETRVGAVINQLRKSRNEAATKGDLEDWTVLRRQELDWRQGTLGGKQDDLGQSIETHEIFRNALRSVLDGEAGDGFPVVEKQCDAAPTILLSDVIKRWASEREPTNKTLTKVKSVVAELEVQHGPMVLGELTPKILQAYKDGLVASGVAPATGNNKLGLLRAICTFALRNRLIRANPCDGINIVVSRKQRAKAKRIAYGADMLSAIFRSPIYSNDSRPVGGAGEAAYWLPLLGLYTGARQRELGQLRPKDVVEETYLDADGREARAWVIRILEDLPDGLRLKNDKSERRVPIHAALIERGFLALVEAAKVKSQARLFPLLRPDRDGNPTASWSKWYGRWQRAQCGVSDRRMVFHSFRHTFKHYARYSLIAPDVQNEITGHETGDTADQYGGLSYPLLPLVVGMDAYRVPQITLPLPPPLFR